MIIQHFHLFIISNDGLYRKISKLETVAERHLRTNIRTCVFFIRVSRKTFERRDSNYNLIRMHSCKLYFRELLSRTTESLFCLLYPHSGSFSLSL